MYHPPTYPLLPVKFPILQLQIIKLNKNLSSHHLKILRIQMKIFQSYLLILIRFRIFQLAKRVLNKIVPNDLLKSIQFSMYYLSNYFCVTGQVSNSTIENNKIEQKSIKSPSDIITNTNESFPNLPSDSDQVSNSSTSKNSPEQNWMKSLSEITTIVNESMKSPSEITTITNELSNNSITKTNTERKSIYSPSEITIIANVLSTNLSSVTGQVSKSKSPDSTLINNNESKISTLTSTLKIYDPSKYYNFDPCFGDNNNIETYVRWNITLNISVEGVED